MAETKFNTTANPALLLEQLRLLAANPEDFRFSDAERREVQRLASQAARSLRDAFETMQSLVYSPLPLIVARVCQDHGIFEALVDADTFGSSHDLDSLCDVPSLSAKTGIDPLVLESIMDYLCVNGMAEELELRRFGPTAFTRQLVAPLFQDAVTHFHDNCLPAFNGLNAWLKSETLTRLPTAFHLGQRSTEDFYTWMETHPVQQYAFHRFMEAQFASLPSWLDSIGFEDAVVNPGGHTISEDVLFVDVGGGTGQQCAALRTRFPELKGRVVLQDRLAVLAKAEDRQDVEKMEYDYLTDQPVKNARAYYFRQIMHNNSDATCVKILRSQLPAMGPNSVILIDEKVLPDEKPAADGPGVEYTAALRLAMCAMFNAQERREAHWRGLLEYTGLGIRELKRYTVFDDAVIVAVKKG